MSEVNHSTASEEVQPKHTPGPWEPCGTKVFGLSEVIAPNADFHEGHLVCMLNHQYGNGDSIERELPRELVEANASLIAASPEMYDALSIGRGFGYSANALLWNAAGILREYAQTSGKSHLLGMAEQLRAKAEAEFAAITKAESEATNV